MNMPRWVVAALIVSGIVCAGTTSGQAPPPSGQLPTVPPVGELKPLGGDRYQIGNIVVDKHARRFTVPGRVHVLGKPLEYLATTPRGMKEYETLLEVDASGSEFNLACILLGLEREPKQEPFYQFSEKPLVGPRVTLTIAWQDAGKRREVSAAEALLGPPPAGRPGMPAPVQKPESVEWVYTGSVTIPPNGQFAADVTGTLVGFVHDGNSIIESVAGVGIGAYGSVSGNAAVLPPVGGAVELIVAVPAQPAGARR